MTTERPSRTLWWRTSSRLLALIAVAACMGVLVAGLVVPVAGLLWFTSSVAAKVSKDLPLGLDTSPLPERSRLVDRKGRLITHFYEQNRVNVPLAAVSMNMQNALLAIEDSRFYEHDGFDLEGTARAFVSNATSDGGVQGGSTITQQLVKMTLLNQAETPAERQAATAQTYARKLLELRYARGLEQEHGKSWILERYLNAAYFGSGAYGVEAAAERYFSRPASELSIAQAALLAGLVKNPTGYEPRRYPQRALQRRNVVLGRMADLGMISARERRQASRSGLGLDPKRPRHGCAAAKPSFFCAYVREHLLQDEALGPDRTARQLRIRNGGLTITSTLDRRAQRAAVRAVRRHVFPKDRAIGALAIVRPGKGNVLALAQSRPMGRKSGEGQTFLNYVVPARYGDANGFQAGSTFKVFVLAAAIEQGIPLDTEIKAPPEIELPVDRFRGCQGQLVSDQIWNPRNSTGSGTFDLYSGTRRSVNTFFAQLELRTGLCQPWRLAKKMGVDLKRSQQVPSFTLGVVNTDPLTMAGAYATFAARGRHCSSRPVKRVLDSDGEVAARYPKRCERVLPPAVADAVNEVLRGLQEPGGFGHNAGLGLDQPAAAKTGTTNDNVSVWYVGYTPNLAAAAMIAGANRQGHWQSLNGQRVGGELIRRASGSGNAGPIWGDAMKRIQRWLPDKEFVRPEPTVIAGRRVNVPDVRGLSFDEATRVLRRVGLLAEWEGSQRRPPRGVVRSQVPQPERELGSGSAVQLRS